VPHLTTAGPSLSQIQLYLSYFGGPSTIDDIVNREAARSVRELLKLRHDPFMFVSDPATSNHWWQGCLGKRRSPAHALALWKGVARSCLSARVACSHNVPTGDWIVNQLSYMLPASTPAIASLAPFPALCRPQHQANLAILDGSGRSLIMRWVDTVVGAFKSYVTWPLTSLKLDDLQALYLARGARDACKLSYTLNVATNGSIASVAVSSSAGGTGSCSAPLLLGKADAVAVPFTLQVQLARGKNATAALNGQFWAPAS
jgi:hypothetical protein